MDENDIRHAHSNPDYVYSSREIFLEQDLYCLASSLGSDFSSWPKRAVNRTMKKKTQQHKETNHGFKLTPEDMAALLVNEIRLNNEKGMKEEDEEIMG